MRRQITKRDIKTQERQVMQMKTIAHHQPTDAQPFPEQRPLHQPPPTALYAEHDAICHGISLGLAVLAVSPPSFLSTPSLLTVGVG